MIAVLALILADLPQIISLVGEILTVINAVKTGLSVYETVKNYSPKTGSFIENVALATNNPDLEAVTKALFVDHKWAPDVETNLNHLGMGF